MVLKIQRPPNMPMADSTDGGGGGGRSRERHTKKQKVGHSPEHDAAAATEEPPAAASGGGGAVEGGGRAVSSDTIHPPPPFPPPPPMEGHHHPRHHQHHDQHPPPPPPPPGHHSNFLCFGCGVSESASSGPLLLFEDPEEDVANEEQHGQSKKPEEEKRYCAGCMTGKKVRVFWPVDSQWYIADVQQYDSHTGEHLLRYPDGDTEWVRIGEDHTTNTQYKEYFRNQSHPHGGGHHGHGDHHGPPPGEGNNNNLTRLPSLGGGNGTNMSFALSAMSQSFGIPAAPSEDEKTMRLKPPGGGPSQQQRLFQQLNLDRTASSMSSFGMYGNGGGGPMNTRQPSFGGHPPPPPHNSNNGGRAPPFQILSPNFTHSFSSKIGTVPSMDFGPPPPHPSGKSSESGGPPPGPPPPHLPYGPPPPHYHHPQSREEGSIPASHSGSSPGTRDGVPGAVSHGSHPPSNWPQQSYSNPPNYYEGGHPPPPMGYGYPPGPDPSSYDSKHPPKRPPHTKSSPTTSKGKGSSSAKAKDRKALAKAWSKPEDEHLLDLVLQMKHPLKWSIIAQSLSDFSAAHGTPERTGKQCRERYVNHLNPRLKHTEFTPLEDATIWRLYATIGTQWAKMSKVIPGRTDNNLKNRFHNLKRQLIREEDGRLRAPEPDNYEDYVHVKKVREIPAFLRSKIEDMWNQPRHIGLIAACSAQEPKEGDAGDGQDKVQDESQPKEGDAGGKASTSGAKSEPVSPGAVSAAAQVAAAEEQRLRKFGPFEPVTEPTQCGRCGLFLPSIQCGDELCAKTKWCRVCTKVSMHLGGNVLRECLNLRKSKDKEIAEGVEKFNV